MSVRPWIQCRFCLLYAITVAPLVPHRDYSEAHLLHHWLSLEPVYAPSYKLYSFTPEILAKHMPSVLYFPWFGWVAGCLVHWDPILLIWPWVTHQAQYSCYTCESILQYIHWITFSRIELQENKMTAYNLAVVFSPTLMRSPSEDTLYFPHERLFSSEELCWVHYP